MLDRKITGNDLTAPKGKLIQRRADWLAAEFLCSHELPQDLLSFDLVTQDLDHPGNICRHPRTAPKNRSSWKGHASSSARKFPNLLNTALDHVLADSTSSMQPT